MRTRAYIGLGSNLNDPVAQVLRALDALNTVHGVRIVVASALYRSEPMGSCVQPEYINAVAAVDTSLAAPDLLRALQTIERTHGRIRDGVRWGPRTLDLDLLTYGDEIRRDPELILPHPGAHERDFVLIPWSTIAGDAVIPGRGRVRDLAHSCVKRGLAIVDSIASSGDNQRRWDLDREA
jgi:2-amino-4-hydroxy-6-hydroxymethyldihydropteridine diphosphokinase